MLSENSEKLLEKQLKRIKQEMANEKIKRSIKQPIPTLKYKKNSMIGKASLEELNSIKKVIKDNNLRITNRDINNNENSEEVKEQKANNVDTRTTQEKLDDRLYLINELENLVYKTLNYDKGETNKLLKIIQNAETEQLAFFVGNYSLIEKNINNKLLTAEALYNILKDFYLTYGRIIFDKKKGNNYHEYFVPLMEDIQELMEILSQLNLNQITINNYLMRLDALADVIKKTKTEGTVFNSRTLLPNKEDIERMVFDLQINYNNGNLTLEEFKEKVTSLRNITQDETTNYLEDLTNSNNDDRLIIELDNKEDKVGYEGEGEEEGEYKEEDDENYFSADEIVINNDNVEHYINNLIIGIGILNDSKRIIYRNDPLMIIYNKIRVFLGLKKLLLSNRGILKNKLLSYIEGELKQQARIKGFNI